MFAFSRPKEILHTAKSFLLAMSVGQAAVLLAGCSAIDFFQNSSGVGIPAPTEVRDFAASTVKGSIVETGEGTTKLTAGLYIVSSIIHTNERCHEFFEALEKYKQDSDFVQRILTAGIAAGSPLLALAGSTSAADVARFTSQVAFGNQLVGFTADVYAFSSFREQLKDHVFSSMKSYQQGKGIDLMMMSRVGVDILDQRTGVSVIKLSDGTQIRVDAAKLGVFLNSTAPTDLLIARGVAADYASLCSLANMKKIVVEALSRTKTVAEASAHGSPTVSKVVPKQ